MLKVVEKRVCGPEVLTEVLLFETEILSVVVVVVVVVVEVVVETVVVAVVVAVALVVVGRELEETGLW